MKETYVQIMKSIGERLASANIPYQFTGGSALLLQGVELKNLPLVTLDVQWDLFEEARNLFSENFPSLPEKNPEAAFFSMSWDQTEVNVRCLFNRTIKTDPYRLAVEAEGIELWVRSLYSYLYDEEMGQFEKQVHTYLASRQQGFTSENEQAWNQNNYVALINRYGKPEDLARKIKENPKWRLHPFYPYLGDLQDKRITHLMGSNGVKAVSMAILGANVKVVDFSRENAAFALDLAKAADVSIEYIVSDVLSLEPEQAEGQDVVLMELGVLHYLIDLHPLFEKVKEILKPGGRFVLHEFHPISTKLITSNGKKHKVTGNYFAPAIESNEVAFSKHMPDDEKDKLSKVIQRKWTLGELITAAGQSGLIIKVLEEEPNHKIHDIGLPKTYTLVAEKAI